MSASEFKAKCLAILDEVARTGEPVTILKRGRPVAVLGPAPVSEAHYPQEELSGTVTIVDDVVAPVLPEDAWDAAKGEGP